jgi:hypothetical protein
MSSKTICTGARRLAALGLAAVLSAGAVARRVESVAGSGAGVDGVGCAGFGCAGFVFGCAGFLVSTRNRSRNWSSRNRGVRGRRPNDAAYRSI